MVIERITLKRDNQTVVIEMDNSGKVVEEAFYGDLRIMRSTYPKTETPEQGRRCIKSIVEAEIGWGFKLDSREVLMDGKLEKTKWEE